QKTSEQLANDAKPTTPSQGNDSKHLKPIHDENRPAFEYKQVTAKRKLDGKVVYAMEVGGKTYTYVRDELDLMKISFAELT
ncbi:hypothetical protein ACJBQ3_10445, partial [Streptococcus suis]